MADMNDSTARPGSSQAGDGSAQVGVLADFGADAIKIEPPGGDDTRSWLPPSMRMGRRRTSAA